MSKTEKKKPSATTRSPDVLDACLDQLGTAGVFSLILIVMSAVSYHHLGLAELLRKNTGAGDMPFLFWEKLRGTSAESETLNFRLGLLFCALAMGLGKGGVPGFSTVSAAGFALVAPVGQVNRLMAFCVPITIMVDLFVGLLYWKDAKWSTAMKIAFFAAIGSGAGMVLNQFLSDDIVRRSVGAIFLLILATQEMVKRQSEKFGSVLASDWTLVFVGLFGGIASYITNQMGPLLNVYMLAIFLSKYQLVGTRAATFILINCVKCGIRFSKGDIDVAAAREGVVLGLVAIDGVILAKMWMRLASDRFFDIMYKRVTVFVMLLMGILLVAGWDFKGLIKWIVQQR